MHRLGRLYQRMNRNAEAERAYRLALRINPALPATLNNLAVLRMLALDYSSADHLLATGFALLSTSLLLNSACSYGSTSVVH